MFVDKVEKGRSEWIWRSEGGKLEKAEKVEKCSGKTDVKKWKCSEVEVVKRFRDPVL